MRDVMTSIMRGALPSVLLPIRRVLIVAVVGHAAQEAAESGSSRLRSPVRKRLYSKSTTCKLRCLGSDDSSAVGDEVRLKD